MLVVYDIIASLPTEKVYGPFIIALPVKSKQGQNRQHTEQSHQNSQSDYCSHTNCKNNNNKHMHDRDMKTINALINSNSEASKQKL